MAKPLTAALATVCALCAAGCGGSRAASASQASPPVPVYVAAANAICARELAHLNSLPQPTTPEETVSYLPVALAAMRRVAGRLRMLHTRAPVTGELAGALASSRRLASMLGGFLHQMQEGTIELATLNRVKGQSETLKRQIDADFRRAGLVKCLQ
jgi:hypothetical protein